MANSELIEFTDDDEANNNASSSSSSSNKNKNFSNQVKSPTKSSSTSLTFQPTVTRSRSRWKLLEKAVKSKQFQRQPLENGSHTNGSINQSMSELSTTDDDYATEFDVESGQSSVHSSPPLLKKSPEPLTSPSTLQPQPNLQTLIQTYDLLTYEYLHDAQSADSADSPNSKNQWILAQWNTPLLNQKPSNLRLYLKFVSNHFTVQDLAGFDNSGNVRLWPCEEALAYLLAFGSLRGLLRGVTQCCELGAGMTALAGLVLVALDLLCPSDDDCRIVLTDGNDRSVRNVGEIVQRNFEDDHPKLYSKMKVQRLRWEVPSDYQNLKGRMEAIIGADCLFVRKHHRDLLNTIDALLIPNQDPFETLKPIGTCYILAPKRGDTMHEFIDLVELDGRFQIWAFEHYDHLLSECRAKSSLSTEQYPYLIVMRRSQSPKFHL